MIIEPAKLSDIPALCDLLNELFTQESEFKVDYQAQSRGLACIIANPEIGSILVARQAGKVDGMVNLLFTVSTALGGPVALLEDLVVVPAQRNRGLGSQLIETAIELAKLKGCRRITLLTDHNNHSAQRFYARFGFKSSTMMPLRLEFSEEK